MKTTLRFIKNEAGKVEGLAYAGFETFKGSPYTSCARETGQNSRDAATGTAPVRVSFNLRQIDRANVPFADALEHSIRCCLEAPQNAKTQAHLERALAAIISPKIKILEISDVNTTGLTGPVDDPESVFTALVKGDGITNKREETSAGSYGIGKNAAYAVSELQTVIYSSCYAGEVPGDTRYACQGRLRLISHADGADKWSAEGYWGNPDFRAIEDVSEVPSWLARTDIGTSIHAVGFDERDQWAARMRLSLVTNFFAAIERDEIEFSVDGVSIARSSLDSVLSDPSLEALAREHDQLAELERARRLLLCIRSETATRHTIAIPGLGDFELHLLVTEGLPREVHVLRNGIYITDNFSKFSQPMRQFPGTREFTAVLEPARSTAGNMPSALLKQLENPAHDAFEPDRITDESDRKRARDQIKKLVTEVRKIIRSLARIEEVQSSQLNELAAMFADSGATRDKGREDGEKDPDAYVYVNPRRPKPRRPSGAAGEGTGKKRGGGERSKPGARSKPGNKSKQTLGSGPAVPLDSVRSAVANGDPLRRKIWFTPTATGNIVLAVEASGLTDDMALSVVACSSGTARNGRIHASVVAGDRVHLEVTLSEPFQGPIELSAAKFVEASVKEAA